MKLIKVTQVYYDTYFDTFGYRKKQRKNESFILIPITS